jgi:hypothetical protein
MSLSKKRGRDSPLDKDQQALMPKDRQLLLFLLTDPPDSLHPSVRQPDEMKDERIYYLVRQRVLFVKQHSDEERVGSGVFHVAQTEQGGGRVEDGDGDLG